MKGSKPSDYSEIEGLFVTVDNVAYMPHLDAPDDKPHPFVYFITIQNDSDEAVMITGRKWIVEEGDEVIGKEAVVVEAEGVIGQKPIISPGKHFSYNSYHVIANDARVRGAFFGRTPHGQKVRVRIPDFQLEKP